MPALAPAIPWYVQCLTIYADDDAAGRRYARELATDAAARGVRNFRRRGPAITADVNDTLREEGPDGVRRRHDNAHKFDAGEEGGSGTNSQAGNAGSNNRRQNTSSHVWRSKDGKHAIICTPTGVEEFFWQKCFYFYKIRYGVGPDHSMSTKRCQELLMIIV